MPLHCSKFDNTNQQLSLFFLPRKLSPFFSKCNSCAWCGWIGDGMDQLHPPIRLVSLPCYSLVVATFRITCENGPLHEPHPLLSLFLLPQNINGTNCLCRSSTPWRGCLDVGGCGLAVDAVLFIGLGVCRFAFIIFPVPKRRKLNCGNRGKKTKRDL